MDTQEVRDLYEAYLQVHQPQEEVEQLDEEAPERITKPTKNKRLMKDAGPARLHNPKNVDEEVVDEAMSSYDRNRRRAAQRAAERNAARDRGQTGNVPGVGYVSPRRERETYTGESGQEYHKSGARMPKKEDQKESFDLFDTILEYLVAEGYADTNENALVIMANMSEEWRQSIVEEVLDEALTGERLQKAKEIIARDPKSPKAKAVKRVADSQEGSDRNDTTPGDLPRDRSNTTLPTGRGGRGRKGLGKTTNRPGLGAPLGGRTSESDRGREAFNR